MAAGLTRKTVTFVPCKDDLQRLHSIAKRRESDLDNILIEALMEGTKIQDPGTFEERLLGLLQERDELLRERDKLAPHFAKVNITASSLRFRYFDLYSQNKSLTINLCGLGMGGRFHELLNRYLFAERREDRPFDNHGQPDSL